MRPSPQRFLRAAVVLLLLEVTLAGAWVPHAIAPRPGAAHVEAAGTPSCPVLHDDEHCLVCQAMTLRVLGAETARLRVPEVVTGVGSRRATPLGRRAAPHVGASPRAPPLVA